MLPSSPVIVWFRRDLRLADNPALSEAAMGGRPVIPVYICESDAPRPLGVAAHWWQHYSLIALGNSLAARGVTLQLHEGRAIDILPRLAAETGATTVVWNRRYAPKGMAIDQAVAQALAKQGVHSESFNASLLFEPERIRTATGQAYKRFAPFWRRCLQEPDPPRPIPAPEILIGVNGLPPPARGWNPASRGLGWAGFMEATWTPGEDAARARLVDFLDEGLRRYQARCERLPDYGTSRLSPHLAFGEIGPRQIWHACRAAGADPESRFLRELLWREFFLHVEASCSDFVERPQKAEFDHFPWVEDEPSWRRFTAGATGYPIVDAGMRALWETGWINNRVRMIVASFLVKNLLLPWQKGESWFWDTLVDAESGSNAGNWQWVAGCGHESAPFFRIFNPVLQGRTFDPHGHYVRRWVPELAGLPDAYIHTPWDAPPRILADAGIRLGQDYPEPIVHHARARERALAAFRALPPQPAAGE